MSTQAARWSACALLLVAIACSGRDAHSILAPAGPEAERIRTLWYAMLAISVVVWLLVMAAMLYGISHGRTAESENASPAADATPDRPYERGIAAATGATALVLLIFLAGDYWLARTLVAQPDDVPMIIYVRGHQWWWEIEYPDSIPSRRVLTANELHVPVGVPIQLELSSRDVIHSVWIPSVQGKKDLIPGHTNRVRFRIDEAGVYRGQCAEFCGHQHAKMGLTVVAETREEFERWRENQLQPAAEPADSVQRRGREVFLGSTCVMCHNVRGTIAGSRFGPDLTHIASRRTLASGTRPNTRGAMGGWISDPQRIKPGVRMPPNQLHANDLQALLTYLESLR